MRAAGSLGDVECCPEFELDKAQEYRCCPQGENEDDGNDD